MLLEIQCMVSEQFNTNSSLVEMRNFSYCFKNLYCIHGQFKKVQHGTTNTHIHNLLV